jgi:hypothetical protein
MFKEDMKITIINRRNPRLVYVVSLKDWMNSDKFIIQAQVPIIGATNEIRKDDYVKGGEEMYG